MRRTQRTAAGLAGLAATLLLHSLFFAVAVWSGGPSVPHPRIPDAVGAGANSGQQDGDPGERRMIVMLDPQYSDAALAPAPVPHLPDPAIEHPSIVAITGPDSLPLPPFLQEAAGEEDEDQDAELIARAKFAGVYESQVRARILRAWHLPAEPEPEPDFSCLVLIHQRRDGRITQAELVLDKCNGSPGWQQSLASAVFAASPLPAPPHPSVYVDSFSLVFHSSAVRNSNRTAQR